MINAYRIIVIYSNRHGEATVGRIHSACCCDNNVSLMLREQRAEFEVSVATSCIIKHYPASYVISKSRDISVGIVTRLRAR
jgi:hypothetical protein